VNQYWVLFIGFFALGYVCAGRGDKYPTTILKGVALIAVVSGVAHFLSGCAQTKVDKVVDISLGQKPAISCPKLVMPPVGTDCLLDIQGDKVTANDCGDTLLRGYVRARSLLKPAAPGTTTP
jgi:hypothetical protein